MSDVSHDREKINFIKTTLQPAIVELMQKVGPAQVYWALLEFVAELACLGKLKKVKAMQHCGKVYVAIRASKAQMEFQAQVEKQKKDEEPCLNEPSQSAESLPSSEGAPINQT